VPSLRDEAFLVGSNERGFNMDHQDGQDGARTAKR
jgi:hypothetical protein